MIRFRKKYKLENYLETRPIFKGETPFGGE